LTDPQDTILIFKSQSLSFLYEGKPTLESYDLYVDELLIGTYSPSFENSFYLDAPKIGTGIHKMQIKAVAKTNSGSLADRLNAERITITRNFVLAVDLSVPDPRIVTLDSTSGVVRVSWQPFARRDFIRYRLVKQCLSDNGNMQGCKTVYIDD